MDFSKCPRCEGEMAPGDLLAQHGVNFKPHGLPFLTLHSGFIKVKPLMCLRCGHIELRGDANQLRGLLKR